MVNAWAKYQALVLLLLQYVIQRWWCRVVTQNTNTEVWAVGKWRYISPSKHLRFLVMLLNSTVTPDRHSDGGDGYKLQCFELHSYWASPCSVSIFMMSLIVVHTEGEARAALVSDLNDQSVDWRQIHRKSMEIWFEMQLKSDLWLLLFRL